MRLTSRLAMSSAWPGSVRNPIADLFALGEPGVWYDPSDMTTMFQDRAGTTPVTAPGQSVGLRLDKSKGLVLGPELVTNGGPDFTSTTGWTGDATLSISGGNLNVSATTGFSTFIPPGSLTTIAGRSYQLIITVVSNNTGNGNIRVGTYSSGNNLYNGSGTLVNGARTYRIIFTATSTSSFLWLQSGGTVGTIVLSSVSVRELPGFHAVANSDAARGVYGIEPLGGRRNRLLSTNNLSTASWYKLSISSVAAATSPDANSAWTVTTSGADGGIVHGDGSTPVAVKTYQVRVKAGTSSTFRFQETVSSNGAYVNFNLSAITAGSPVTVGTGGVTISSATIVDEGDGWRLCSITATRTSGTAGNFFLVVVGASGSTMTFRMPQAEVGSTATPYQRVVSQYEVTEAGKPTLHYVQYDGVDDGYVTPTITPGTDKVQVFAGVRKLSDAAVGLVTETSTNAGSNAGAFFFSTPTAAGLGTYRFSSRVTVNASVDSPNNFAAPITNVLTLQSDIGVDLVTMRINGTQVAQSTTDQGTGNYLAYPLYIGRRGGTSFPFNGRDYGLIVRFGSNLDAATISKIERLLSTRTGVTI